MDGKREFKIVISEIGEGEPAALVRCPECGCRKCKLTNAMVLNGPLVCEPDGANGMSIIPRTQDMPQTNGLNIVLICEEGHTFWYWLHTAGFHTVITHGVIGTSVQSEVEESHE